MNADVRVRIHRAIQNRLTTAPEQYGAPLRKTLKGLWKLRVGDYRIVYSIRANRVLIFGAIHRLRQIKDQHLRVR